ncbi:ABC transporter ATP-binding protein [Thermodesulfobacteriota bacterium]
MKKFQSSRINPLRDFVPLKEYFVQNSKALLLGFIFMLLMDFLQVIIPLVIKKAIDLLTLQASSSLILVKQGLIIVGISVLIAVFRYLWRYLLIGHSRIIEEALRNKLFSHIQTLSFSFYKKVKTGDIMSRAINDINAVRMATGFGMIAMIDGIVLGIAAIGFMISINLNLTLISLIPTPLIIILTKHLTKRMSVEFENVQKAFSGLTEKVRESFAGIRVIKAYKREIWGKERLENEGKIYINANMNLAKSLALFFPVMAIFTNAGLAIVIWFGGRQTILGDITIGDFVAFISYLNILTWPMMAMGWVANLIQRGAASMRRINLILNEVAEIRDCENPIRVKNLTGSIDMKEIIFKYPGNPRTVLANINQKIDPGETVAIVGKVGSGKTTLLHIIPRLLSATKGKVFIGGFDIKEISLNSLRANIGFVSQEIFIFSDTIKNNILLGRSNISQIRIVEALRTAQLWEEIQSFDNGLDTILGERGITLSGGQRQRLSIARALITDPPVLILDDALSMVDTDTEEKILNRILKLRENETNLIVSHRISTISRADRVIVLDRGVIAEEGNHEKLLEQGSIYKTLYEKQILSMELELGVKSQ